MNLVLALVMEIADMHPAIELMLARMDSNPEEFEDKEEGRWAEIIVELGEVAEKVEWNLLVTKLSSIHMDSIHKKIMQELCAPNRN